MKTSIAIALSHHPKLLILDEATSGLDPIVREEVLDIFHSFVKNKENSILLSSHISSDLEKIADYLVFIHKGNMVFTESKEKLVQNYGVLRTNKNPFDEIDQTDIFSFRKNKDSWEVLINNKEQFTEKYPSENLQNASIDDILTLYIKGEQL
ncbi:hypothetical protein [Enterococcus olivae]